MVHHYLYNNLVSTRYYIVTDRKDRYTMKIAVMFGSFNPLTNAHLAAMKTAVDALQADRGLFVATNGQYLRRKT